jgi:polysaccharide biosynthesis protein PslH
MKILVVSPHFPSPTWGFSARSYYLLKSLACKHTISLLVLRDSSEEGKSYGTSLESLTHTVHVIPRPASHSKRLLQLANMTRGMSYTAMADIVAELQEALDTLLARDHHDIVLFESVTIAGYRLPENVTVVIDQHNIEYELLQRTYQREKAWLRKFYNWQESRLLKPIEIERCRRANVVLVTSEREHQTLKGVLPKSIIEVVPNGVDTVAFQAQDTDQEVPGRIIFTGTLDYYPNIDAVHFFAQNCWPLIRAQVPGATWQIVGKNPPREVQRLAALPGVTVTGSVPDMKPYFAASTVAIAPLLVGSGTRLKILEALAMGKAVVSTSIGCEGLSVRSGEHLLVADQPATFAQAVVKLISNPVTRTALGTAGRALVEAEYSWEKCGERLLHILEGSEIVC